MNGWSVKKLLNWLEREIKLAREEEIKLYTDKENTGQYCVVLGKLMALEQCQNAVNIFLKNE